MYNIAVIGDKESVYAYASLGMEVFSEQSSEELSKLLKNLVSNEYAVIFITENLAQKVWDDIEKYQDRIMPAIILIPGVSDNTGLGLKKLSKSVERAVGSDIIS